MTGLHLVLNSLSIEYERQAKHGEGEHRRATEVLRKAGSLSTRKVANTQYYCRLTGHVGVLTPGLMKLIDTEPSQEVRCSMRQAVNKAIESAVVEGESREKAGSSSCINVSAAAVAVRSVKFEDSGRWPKDPTLASQFASELVATKFPPPFECRSNDNKKLIPLDVHRTSQARHSIGISTLDVHREALLFIYQRIDASSMSLTLPEEFIKPSPLLVIKLHKVDVVDGSARLIGFASFLLNSFSASTPVVHQLTAPLLISIFHDNLPPSLFLSVDAATTYVKSLTSQDAITSEQLRLAAMSSKTTNTEIDLVGRFLLKCQVEPVFAGAVGLCLSQNEICERLACDSFGAPWMFGPANPNLPLSRRLGGSGAVAGNRVEFERKEYQSCLYADALATSYDAKSFSSWRNFFISREHLADQWIEFSNAYRAVGVSGVDGQFDVPYDWRNSTTPVLIEVVELNGRVLRELLLPHVDQLHWTLQGREFHRLEPPTTRKGKSSNHSDDGESADEEAPDSISPIVSWLRLSASWKLDEMGESCLRLSFFDIRNINQAKPLACNVYIHDSHGHWHLACRSQPFCVFTTFQTKIDDACSHWDRRVMGEKEPQWFFLHAYRSGDDNHCEHIKIELPTLSTFYDVQNISSLDPSLRLSNELDVIFKLAKLGMPNVARPWLWSQLVGVPNLKIRLEGGRQFNELVADGWSYELSSLPQINEISNRVGRFLNVDKLFESKIRNVLIALSVFSCGAKSIDKNNFFDPIVPTFALGLFLGRLLLNFSGQQFSQEDAFLFVLASSSYQFDSLLPPLCGVFCPSSRPELRAPREDCLLIRAALQLLYPKFAKILSASHLRLEDVIQPSLQCLFADVLPSCSLYRLWDLVFAAIDGESFVSEASKTFSDIKSTWATNGNSFGYQNLICCQRNEISGEVIDSPVAGPQNEFSIPLSTARRVLISFAFGVLVDSMAVVPVEAKAEEIVESIVGMFTTTRDPVLVVNAVERGAFAVFGGLQTRYIADLATAMRRAEFGEIDWQTKQRKLISELVMKPQVVGEFNEHADTRNKRIKFTRHRGLTMEIFRKDIYPMIKVAALYSSPSDALLSSKSYHRLVFVVECPKKWIKRNLSIRVAVTGGKTRTIKCDREDLAMIDVPKLPVRVKLLVMEEEIVESQLKIYVVDSISLENFYFLALSDGSKVPIGITVIEASSSLSSLGRGHWDIHSSPRVNVAVDIEKLVRNFHEELTGKQLNPENLVETASHCYCDGDIECGFTRSELAVVLLHSLPSFLPYLNDIMRQFSRIPEYQRNASRCRISLVNFVVCLVCCISGSLTDKCSILFDLFGTHSSEHPTVGQFQPSSSLPPHVTSPHAVREGLVLDKHLPVGSPAAFWRNVETTTNAIDVTAVAEAIRHLLSYQEAFVDFGTALSTAFRIFVDTSTPRIVSAVMRSNGQSHNLTTLINKKIKIASLLFGKPIIDVKEKKYLSDWDVPDPCPKKSKVLELTIWDANGKIIKSSHLIDKDGMFVDDSPIDLLPKPIFIDKYSFLTRFVANNILSDSLNYSPAFLGHLRESIDMEAFVEVSLSPEVLGQLESSILEKLRKAGQRAAEIKKKNKNKNFLKILELKLEEFVFHEDLILDTSRYVRCVGSFGTVTIASDAVPINSHSLISKFSGTLQLPINTTFQEVSLSIEQLPSEGKSSAILGSSRLLVADLTKSEGSRKVTFRKGLKDIGSMIFSVSTANSTNHFTPTYLHLHVLGWSTIADDPIGGGCRVASQAGVVSAILGNSKRKISPKNKITFPFRLETNLRFEIANSVGGHNLTGALDVLSLVKSNEFVTSHSVPLYTNGVDIAGYLNVSCLFQLPTLLHPPRWLTLNLNMAKFSSSQFDSSPFHCRIQFENLDSTAAVTSASVCHARRLGWRCPIDVLCPEEIESHPLQIQIIAHTSGELVASCEIENFSEIGTSRKKLSLEMDLASPLHSTPRLGRLDFDLSISKTPTTLRAEVGTTILSVCIREIKIEHLREGITPLLFAAGFKIVDSPMNVSPNDAVVLRSHKIGNSVVWPTPAILHRQWSSDRWLCLGTVTDVDDFVVVGFVDIWELCKTKKNAVDIPMTMISNDSLVLGHCLLIVEFLDFESQPISAVKVTLAKDLVPYEDKVIPPGEFLFVRASTLGHSRTINLWKGKDEGFLSGLGHYTPILRLELVDSRKPHDHPVAWADVPLANELEEISTELYGAVPRRPLASVVVAVDRIGKLFVELTPQSKKSRIFKIDCLRDVPVKLANARMSQIPPVVLEAVAKGKKKISAVEGVTLPDDEWCELGQMDWDDKFICVVEDIPEATPLDVFVNKVHALGRGTRSVGTPTAIARQFRRSLVDVGETENLIRGVKWTGDQLTRRVVGGNSTASLNVCRPSSSCTEYVGWEVPRRLSSSSSEN